MERRANKNNTPEAPQDSPAALEYALGHTLVEHSSTQEHHRHAHAPASVHASGHHLLQVEGLSIGFTLYETQQSGGGLPVAQRRDSKAAGAQEPVARHRPLLSSRQHYVPVIHDLHISVHTGEIVAIVGASGSGKTLLADAVMGMFELNVTVKGRIWFDGIQQDAASLARLRGHGISLVPQSISYLDPLMKVGRQVQGFSKRGDRRERVKRQQELFARYDLEPEVADQYPFELSGGMARRVLLCCALMDDPRVIIADEPTPGLDLELARLALADFREYADAGGGVLLITHDIELALCVADRVAVFNQGTVVEETAVANFASPKTLKHSFSRALWHALPEHDFVTEACCQSHPPNDRLSNDCPPKDRPPNASGLSSGDDAPC